MTQNIIIKPNIEIHTMTKPQSTYTRIKNQGKIRVIAEDNKRTINQYKHQTSTELQQVVDEVSIEQAKSWLKILKIAQNSENERVQGKVRKVLEEIRTKLFENQQSMQQLQAISNIPAKDIIAMQAQPASPSYLLPFIILAIRILEVIVTLKK